ncbi:DUF5305 family protein [Haloarcula amylovorans]|uniref:DUF5305 family protein n=1 Tax=Haloarcula amylovorans TaxID=2562280 RepID=UPI001075DEE7|nr:DUF5305 family protein [Halomicroarcula amylolytica]
MTDQTNQQTIQSNISTQAVVTENTTLYTPNQTLENQPVYLRSAAPSPTLILTTTVPSNQKVAVSQQILVNYTADRGDETFWKNSTVIKQTEVTTHSGRTQMKTQVNPEMIQERVQELDETIGDAGSVNVDLRFVVSYTTARYNGTLSKPINIQITDNWYQIDSPTASRTHSIPDERTVTVPTRQRGGYIGLGILGGIALLLGIAVSIVSWIEPNQLDSADMVHELQRLRYAEWISTGTIPDDAGETLIEVASLEELVDIGIDTNNRTIYDPSRSRYAIIDGTTVYYYDRV